MADEIASLGLAIDSSAVAAANAELERFQKAGAGAQAAAAQFAAKATSLAAPINAVAQKNKQLAASVGLAGYQMQNLGFQLNDVTTGLLSGQSPFTIMAQQGGQIFQILSMAPGGVGGALKSLGMQAAALFTPARA